jgi:hypothetical protein
MLGPLGLSLFLPDYLSRSSLLLVCVSFLIPVSAVPLEHEGVLHRQTLLRSPRMLRIARGCILLIFPGFGLRFANTLIN